jgi:hypothetical protein
MSYVIEDPPKSGKWYQMNPPDAKSGDECKGNNEWQFCEWAHQGNICSLQRRRLISPGEGFRICEFKDKVSMRNKAEILYSDAKDWSPFIGSDSFVYDLYGKNRSILAIRVRIEQDKGQELLWSIKTVAELKTLKCDNLVPFINYDESAGGIHWIVGSGRRCLCGMYDDGKDLVAVTCSDIFNWTFFPPKPSEPKPVEGEGPRIYTRCPACGNDTLIINKGHLLCSWHECPNPVAIDRLFIANQQRTPTPISVKDALPENERPCWFLRGGKWILHKYGERDVKKFIEQNDSTTHWLYCEPPYAIPPSPKGIKDGEFDEWKIDRGVNGGFVIGSIGWEAVKAFVKWQASRK